MLKKPMTYTDIDGNSVTEDFYFNMTKAELLKLEFSEDEGLSEKIKRIQKPGAKGREILEVFDAILGYSYGIRKDGKFIKPAGCFEEFMTTEAYSDLLFEIATDANKAAQFVNEIMPPALMAEVQQEVAAAKAQGVDVNEINNAFMPEKKQPAGAHPIQDVTPYEVSVHNVPNANNMTESELLAAMGVEETVTAGYTDKEIKFMSQSDLRKAPREVLVRAYQLKTGAV